MIMLFGGIEGGSSNSRIVILDEAGSLVSTAEGPHTNQWLIGMDETVRRLLHLIDVALKRAKLPSEETQLSHVCMALSGVDTEQTRISLIDALKAAKPDLAKTIRICNDTIGTFMTATDDSGIVLIAGTGSNCKYIRKDLSFERTGGYGYLLGDGGSAYWIANQTIVKFLEIEDGLVQWEPGIEAVRRAIYEHFGIENSQGLLYEFYEKFDKTHVAQLCKRLASEAQKGDKLCQQAFYNAGIQLGRQVLAALRHAEKDLNSSTKSLPVICCGQVFHSWDLLRSGFYSAISDPNRKHNWSGCLNLIQLQISAGYGAARLAARLDAGINLPVPENAFISLDSVPIE